MDKREAAVGPAISDALRSWIFCITAGTRWYGIVLRYDFLLPRCVHLQQLHAGATAKKVLHVNALQGTGQLTAVLEKWSVICDTCGVLRTAI